jgi:hypothetical protein
MAIGYRSVTAHAEKRDRHTAYHSMGATAFSAPGEQLSRAGWALVTRRKRCHPEYCSAIDEWLFVSVGRRHGNAAHPRGRALRNTDAADCVLLATAAVTHCAACTGPWNADDDE